MASLWRAPPEWVGEQLRSLVDTLASVALAPTRAALIERGSGHLQAELTAAAARHAAAWDLQVLHARDLAGLHTEGREVAEAAYKWVRRVRKALKHAEAGGAQGVPELRERLGLSKVHSARVRGLLDRLRIVLPELQDCRLPAGAQAKDPAFLAEGARHRDALDAHEAAVDAKKRELAAARRGLAAAKKSARSWVERLLADVMLLRVEHGLPSPGMNLQVLKDYQATRARRGRAAA